MFGTEEGKINEGFRNVLDIMSTGTELQGQGNPGCACSVYLFGTMGFWSVVNLFLPF